MTKRYASLLASILLLSLVFVGCKDDETTDPTLQQGTEYFPIDSGRYVEFIVDSIHYDDFTGTIDTFRFEIRELNQSTFTDLAGNPAIRLERYRRDSISQPWFISDVWAFNRTANTAEKVEENIRYIKIRFPLIPNQVWDGNLLNELDAWDYELVDVNKPFTINGFSFDSTITILQTGLNDIPNGQTEPFLNKQIGKEVYAKNVGLIYKELQILEGDPTQPPALPFDQRIKRGFKLKMQLSGYSPQ